MVGTNGLVDTKETITAGVGNGVINYTLNYQNAISSSINGCTDSDNDGVPDVIDIDDDNDGITDFVESNSCPSLSALTMVSIAGATAVVPTFTPNTINATDNLSLTSTNGNWNNSYSNQSLNLPIHLEYRTNNLGAAMIGFIPVFAKKSVLNTYTDEAVRFYHEGANFWGQMPSAWDLGATANATTDLFE